MAETRPPNAVTSEDIDQKTARAIFICEGIQTGPFGGEKNSKVDVVFKERGLIMTADVQRKNGLVKYKKVIRELPSALNIDQCTFKCKKDQVVVTLKKATECSWAVQLSSSGLDQLSSEESD